MKSRFSPETDWSSRGQARCGRSWRRFFGEGCITDGKPVLLVNFNHVECIRFCLSLLRSFTRTRLCPTRWKDDAAATHETNLRGEQCRSEIRGANPRSRDRGVPQALIFSQPKTHPLQQVRSAEQPRLPIFESPADFHVSGRVHRHRLPKGLVA